MKKFILREKTKYEGLGSNRKRIRRQAITALASAVVFVTTYSLIIPASTLESFNYDGPSDYEIEQNVDAEETSVSQITPQEESVTDESGKVETDASLPEDTVSEKDSQEAEENPVEETVSSEEPNSTEAEKTPVVKAASPKATALKAEDPEVSEANEAKAPMMLAAAPLGLVPDLTPGGDRQWKQVTNISEFTNDGTYIIMNDDSYNTLYATNTTKSAQHVVSVASQGSGKVTIKYNGAELDNSHLWKFTGTEDTRTITNIGYPTAYLSLGNSGNDNIIYTNNRALTLAQNGSNWNLSRVIGNNNQTYYLTHNNGTFSKSTSTTGNLIRIYKLVEKEEDDPNPGSVDDPISGQILLDQRKTIDYLGDGVDNPDTDVEGENYYRLYLTAGPEIMKSPVDLVIVVDKSNSMNKSDITTSSGNMLRDEAVSRMINGSTTQMTSDGLVARFLALNPGNRVSVVSFDGVDQDSYSYTGDSAVLLDWTDEAHLGNGLLDCTHNYAGTNYCAALQRVLDKLKQPSPNENKAIIFISDGSPSYYVTRNQITGTETRTGNGTSTGETYNTPTIRYFDDYFKPELDKLDTDAIFYTIGIGPTSGSDKIDTSVLNHMSTTGDTLASLNYDTILNDIKNVIYGNISKLDKLTVTDTLSYYVDLAETDDLKLTLKTATGSYTTETVLYEHGAKTAAGEALIDTIGFDTSDPENVKVSFKIKTVDAAFMDMNPRFTLSFNVKVNPAAYDAFEQRNGYKEEDSGHTMHDVSGDRQTDYTGNGNNTSSNQGGFHSNKEATITYELGGNKFDDVYPHPVVQTRYPEFTFVKAWNNGADKHQGDSVNVVLHAYYKDESDVTHEIDEAWLNNWFTAQHLTDSTAKTVVYGGPSHPFECTWSKLPSVYVPDPSNLEHYYYITNYECEETAVTIDGVKYNRYSGTDPEKKNQFFDTSDNKCEYELEDSTTSKDMNKYTQVITNASHVKIDVKVFKTWSDSDTKDHSTDSITVELFDGAVSKGTQVLNDENYWYACFEEVPKFDNDGNEIEYTVKEVSMTVNGVTYSLDGNAYKNGSALSGYQPIKSTVNAELSDDGVNLEADFLNVEVKDLPVTKEWQCKDADKGSSVTVGLYTEDGAQVTKDAYGNTISALTLNSGNSWAGSFKNLPVVDSDNAVINYVVKETAIRVGSTNYTLQSDGSYKDGSTDSGFMATYSDTNGDGINDKIVNFKSDNMTKCKVSKVWDDDGEDHSADSVVVTLTADGVSTGRTVTLNSGNSWTHLFENLPRYKADGHTEIAYSAVENSYTVANGAEYIITDVSVVTGAESGISWDEKTGTEPYIITPEKWEWVNATSFTSGNTYRIIANGMALAISNGSLVMTTANDTDTAQQWIVRKTGNVNGGDIGTIQNVATNQYLHVKSWAQGLAGYGLLELLPGNTSEEKTNHIDLSGANCRIWNRSVDSTGWRLAAKFYLKADGSTVTLDKVDAGKTGGTSFTFQEWKKTQNEVSGSRDVYETRYGTAVTITNTMYAPYELPETGGEGTLPLVAGGAALIALATALFIKRKKVSE